MTHTDYCMEKKNKRLCKEGCFDCVRAFERGMEEGRKSCTCWPEYASNGRIILHKTDTPCPIHRK